MGLRDTLAGLFSFLQSRAQIEERLAQYVIREHKSGRPLVEILEDPYVKNRTTPEQVARLLDRPDLIRAVGNDVVSEARQTV